MVDEYLMKKAFVGELIEKRGLSAGDAEKEYVKLLSAFTASVVLVAFSKVPQDVRKTVMGEIDLNKADGQKDYLLKAKKYLEGNKVSLGAKDFAQAVKMAYDSFDGGINKSSIT